MALAIFSLLTWRLQGSTYVFQSIASEKNLVQMAEATIPSSFLPACVIGFQTEC